MFSPRRSFRSPPPRLQIPGLTPVKALTPVRIRTKTNVPAPVDTEREVRRPESSSWVTGHSKSIIFLILTLAAVGVYLAFTIPVAVFPETDFPRIIVGVDNGVMPIDQMEVTITRLIEEAVNSVPGLQEVVSITSRGSAEVDLYFDWNVDIVQTLQQVDAAVARIQVQLPPTASVDNHRLSFASFPIL